MRVRRFVEMKQDLIACQIVWDGMRLAEGCLLVNSGNGRTCLFHSCPYSSHDRQQTNPTMEVEVQNASSETTGVKSVDSNRHAAAREPSSQSAVSQDNNENEKER